MWVAITHYFQNNIMWIKEICSTQVAITQHDSFQDDKIPFISG